VVQPKKPNKEMLDATFADLGGGGDGRRSELGEPDQVELDMRQNLDEEIHR